MELTPKDIELVIDGMGIVMYSPAAAADIPVGSDFLSSGFTRPEQVAEHLKKGDIVGFCTGSGGEYTLKVRSGQPPEEISHEYPVSISLGIDARDGMICFADLFWLSEWEPSYPEEQTVRLEGGFYHAAVLTRCPPSGIWGDGQIIYVYLSSVLEMPEMAWDGVPQLFTE